MVPSILGAYMLVQQFFVPYSIDIVVKSLPIEVKAEVTMYNPVPSQTDSTPNVTASGVKVNKQTAACPEWIPFGTWIKVVGKKYICQDRMHKRYRSGNYFDIVSDSYDKAIEFGRQKLNVMIYDKKQGNKAIIRTRGKNLSGDRTEVRYFGGKSKANL